MRSYYYLLCSELTIGGTVNPILKDVKLGLDLQGGFEVLYQVEPLKDGQTITESVVADTADALNRRVNVLGVSEPNIQVESNNRIRVQLAGVEDQESARELLATQANLTFRDVNDRLLLDGNDLKAGKAKADFDENGNPMVTLEMNEANKFGEITTEISQMKPNNQLVIWLDFEEGVDSFAAEIGKAGSEICFSSKCWRTNSFINCTNFRLIFNARNERSCGNIECGCVTCAS